MARIAGAALVFGCLVFSSGCSRRPVLSDVNSNGLSREITFEPEVIVGGAQVAPAERARS